jgi:hypothetical protein
MSELNFEVTDVTRQKLFTVPHADSDTTVQQLVNDLVGRMRLPRFDADGLPVAYQARVERLDSYLNDTERVGDVLQAGDKLTLEPNIEAGGR